MKTTKFATTTAIMLFAFFTNIASVFSQNNALKVHPFSGTISYERLFAPNISGNVAFKVLPYGGNLSFFNEYKLSWKSYSITPEIRFYMKEDRKKALAGFYLAPYVRAGKTTVKATVTGESDLKEVAEFTGRNFGIGGTAGWQWVTPNGFTIGTAIGYGFSSLGLKDADVTFSDGTTETVSFKGLGFGFGFPQLRFSIGYAF